VEKWASKTRLSCRIWIHLVRSRCIQFKNSSTSEMKTALLSFGAWYSQFHRSSSVSPSVSHRPHTDEMTTRDPEYYFEDVIFLVRLFSLAIDPIVSTNTHYRWRTAYSKCPVTNSPKTLNSSLLCLPSPMGPRLLTEDRMSNQSVFRRYLRTNLALLFQRCTQGKSQLGIFRNMSHPD